MSEHPAWKRFIWTSREDLKEIGFALLSGLPGASGCAVRRMVYRRSLKHLGAGSVLKKGFRTLNPQLISIGANCRFATNVFINGGGGVTIGNWVGIGPDSKVWSVNHRFDDPEQPLLLQGYEKAPVVIEDDVWLGANVFIAPGVTIGRGAIIAAGAVLNKSIPAFALVCGNPGRVIGWRKKPKPPNAEAVDQASASV